MRYRSSSQERDNIQSKIIAAKETLDADEEDDPFTDDPYRD